MDVSKFVILLLQALVQILVSSCKIIECSSDCDKDADGIPLSDEWNKQTFLLAVIRSAITDYTLHENRYNDEKQNS